MNADNQFYEYVFQIHSVLDKLDYYRLFGLKHDAEKVEIQKMYHSIAAKFHPDRNRNADKKVKKALYEIFKRINEAYHILSDPKRRKLYDDELNLGSIRLSQEIIRQKIDQKPEDTIKSPNLRQFYLKAKEALDGGNVMTAKLHIKMALSQDRENKAILDLFHKIQNSK